MAEQHLNLTDTIFISAELLNIKLYSVTGEVYEKFKNNLNVQSRFDIGHDVKPHFRVDLQTHPKFKVEKSTHPKFKVEGDTEEVS